MRETSMPDEGAAGKACTGRLIAMATEEMTKQADVIPDVQKPCSNILVSLGERQVLVEIFFLICIKFLDSLI